MVMGSARLSFVGSMSITKSSDRFPKAQAFAATICFIASYFEKTGNRHPQNDSGSAAPEFRLPPCKARRRW
jgi:hypothetical protein